MIQKFIRPYVVDRQPSNMTGGGDTLTDNNGQRWVECEPYEFHCGTTASRNARIVQDGHIVGYVRSMP